MRRLLDAIRRPPWRAPALALAIVLVVGIAYAIWSPGEDDVTGGDSRGRNAIWMQHGWLGADAWFVENGKIDRMADFRDPQRIERMLRDLRSNGISDLFPHLCPAGEDGRVAPSDDGQVERFLDAAATLGERGEPIRVMPWVGGRRESTAQVEDPAWRRAFVASARDLLERHPRLAGVHVNIEPWRDGDAAGLALLDELRAGLPKGKLISVSGYPPPTIWHPFKDVHWGRAYLREVARRADQVAVMMYDTALRQEKIYRWLVRSWTHDVIMVTERADLLIGVPTYDDSGTPWHVPRVENLENALMGIHPALVNGWLPRNYQGVAIYSEWETSSEEWSYWHDHFVGASQPASAGGPLLLVVGAASMIVGIWAGWTRIRLVRLRRTVWGILAIASTGLLYGVTSEVPASFSLVALFAGFGMLVGCALSALPGGRRSVRASPP